MNPYLKNQDFEQTRTLIVRLFYGFAILIWIFKYTNGVWLHQVAHPTLAYITPEEVQWLWYSTGIPSWILATDLRALTVDLLLLASMLLAFCYPRQRWWPPLFSGLLCTYCLTGYLYYFARGHNLSGFLLMSFLPWFQSHRRFAAYFQFMRYFLLYILCSAALWKLYNGVVWDYDNQLPFILKMQHAEYVVHHPDAWRSHWVRWLLDQPALNLILLKGAWVLQLSCLVGFFTKKFDYFLLTAVVLFFIGDWLVMNLPFYEMYILVITLLPWQAVRLAAKPPSLISVV
ncbi:hypothetical protein [Catalinimonas alkaloidigena]|nr:hypothetical protein [Catalinimonas alkaloidigena]